MVLTAIERRIAQIPRARLLTVVFAIGLPLFMAEAYIVGDIYIASALGLLWTGMGIKAIVEEVRA